MSKVFGTEAFTKEIPKAIDCLTAAGETISLDNITEQLTDYIVDNHNGKTSLYVYKDLWNTHVEIF
ncbi:uncharacterized protein EV154DRAFT_566136 [Mucor mucedo]|uniref:uncharacterized protein n=1 Tax=Mucor mucedo TaxID=29922 RepID=UPI00221F6A35|nr:uncharacterized protein EV154DRAFT_566136 [Mucor mucedo]KAI7888647.1 hypothetical protein EV154DRAFT_566136 [Mucor mucedo]